MIDAKFYRKAEDDSIHMEFRGHAGTAPKGEDLVCSAATMVVYTAAQALQFLYEQGRLRSKPNVCIQEGYASVSAQPKPEALFETTMVFWVAQAGAHVLRYNYPQNIQLMPMRM